MAASLLASHFFRARIAAGMVFQVVERCSKKINERPTRYLAFFITVAWSRLTALARGSRTIGLERAATNAIVRKRTSQIAGAE
jgi:hypothetical protein